MGKINLFASVENENTDVCLYYVEAIMFNEEKQKYNVCECK